MRVLSYEQLVTIHDDQITMFGGLPGCTQQGINKLKYIVDAPFASFAGEELYPSIETKAAVLMTKIVQNHPFLDGNKRTGLSACLLFLELNGYQYHFDEQEAIELTLDLAAKNIDQEEITDWLEKITSKPE